LSSSHFETVLFHMELDVDVAAAAGYRGRGPKRGRSGNIVEALAERSELAELLEEFWSWGVLSSAHVRELAHAAVVDGLRHPQLVRLAKIRGVYD